MTKNTHRFSEKNTPSELPMNQVEAPFWSEALVLLGLEKLTMKPEADLEGFKEADAAGGYMYIYMYLVKLYYKTKKRPKKHQKLDT